MNQTEKAKRFAELHVKGAPLLLYNAWDAGSAKAIHCRRKSDRDKQLVRRGSPGQSRRRVHPDRVRSADRRAYRGDHRSARHRPRTKPPGVRRAES